MVDASAILEAIKDGKRKKIKVYPQYVTRASEVGHPCERYLVYSITAWDQKQPHDAELEFIFEGGRVVEDLAIQDFIDAGFKVYRPEPDKAVREFKPQISGHLDVRVDFGDLLKEQGINQQVLTGEIKGLNIYDWEQMNSVEDFLNSKKPWLKKYPAQLMSYLYMKAEEWSFFYLKSIPRFQPKIIFMRLDYEYMEGILKKTERVEKHISEKTLPERIDDLSVCEYCPFKLICLPNMERSSIQIINNEQLNELLQRREQLQDAAREYEGVDKQIKKMVDGQERLVCGDYMISGKWIDRKGYTCADTRYYQAKIVNIIKQARVQ